MAEPTVAVAGASRRYPGEIVNGDAWHVDQHAGAWRVAVLDGLGHGYEAATAAWAAVAYLSAHPELGLDDALRGCHAVLRGTRGAAISLARIDPEAGQLAFAGVGNVEARLWRAGRQHRPVAYRGIVGVVLPTIRVFELRLEEDWLLLLHTDGVSSRAEVETLPSFARRDPSALANDVLRGWARETDDATVVVAGPGTLAGSNEELP